MNRRRCARILSGMFLASLLALPAQALTLEQARTLLTDAYIDPVPQEVLDQTSISAMLEQLGDPYTQYFTAEEYQAFLSSMEDASLVGIGVVSIAGTDGMTITSVLEGSPAQAAGLREGDRIVAVDGRSTLGVDAAQVSSWIQGEAGTQVTVTYQRGEEKHTVTLTRAAITVPTTTSRLVEGRVGYLECTTFGTDTYPHIQEGISACQDEARVWVMDLRGNGGGLTSAASQAVSAFTDAQNTGYLRDGSGSYGAFSSSLSPLTDKAVIVLSDGYTASSSELFSACIRDLNAGIVVGGRTFGKGVAQTLFDQSVYPDYFPDGDAMKITTNRYFSPAGATTDTVGIIPHLLVDPDLADEVAILLSAAPPDGDTAGYYRLDLGWRWYIDGEQASSPAYRDAFAQLLSAIPPTVDLWQGTGGSNGWTCVSPEEAAQTYGLTYLDRSFSDTSASPYAESIDLLASYQILSGTGDGTFHPEDSLTRAELATMLAAALNCNMPSSPAVFSDVSMDSWYGPSVYALEQLGLLSGDGKGKFHPDDPVTHEQLFSILARLAENLSLNFYEASKGIPEDTMDSAALRAYAPWARESVWLLTNGHQNLFGQPLSLLWDSPEQIAPQDAATREETASLLCQVLIYTGVLPV